jgi:ParB family chromosome partitioning protein
MEQKLGRGLSDLLSITPVEENQRLAKVSNVNIESIVVRPTQPRQNIDPIKLHELSESIRQNGILQPLVVRKDKDRNGRYELIAGERRLRAARKVGLSDIPVNVIDCSDQDVYAIALIENIQRDQLNSLEEAAAIQKLLTDHGCTQENLAKMVAKSRSYIANSLRLLSLPDPVKQLIISEEISVGHAKILAGRQDAVELSETIVNQHLSVRDLEHLVDDKKQLKKDVCAKDYDQYENPDAVELAERVAHAIGLGTKIKLTKNGGVVTIVCRTKNELESLATTLINSVG